MTQRNQGASIEKTRAETDARAAWHHSQYRWHKRRIEPLVYGFHRRQAVWHLARIPFSYIAHRTLRKYRKRLADSIMSSNALLQRLVNG